MQVVQAPDQKLRVKTKPVKKITPDLLKTIKEMVKLTKTFVDPEGVGLASTQVGLDGKFFVSKQTDGSFKPFFNPRIFKYSKATKVYTEGCLSIPNYWGEVTRHTWVDVSFMDEKGQHQTTRLKGLMAHIFQHEVDHLHGKLFMDLVLEQKGKLYKVVGKDRAGADVFEEVPL
jgi:peptide deformylase